MSGDSRHVGLYVLETGLIECADFSLFSPNANPGARQDMPVRSYLVVLERQQLRERGASREELEANRAAIVEAQWRLTREAIETHSSHDQAKAA